MHNMTKEMLPTKEAAMAYYDGLCDGVYTYAYMRDGVFYVGTTGRTLDTALAEINSERAKFMLKFSEST
jgi:hypothetical protein